MRVQAGGVEQVAKFLGVELAVGVDRARMGEAALPGDIESGP